MEKTVQIYYTSDTHGHIFPVNYAANCSEKSGLLNLADQMEKDGNTLVSVSYTHLKSTRFHSRISYTPLHCGRPPPGPPGRRKLSHW